MSDFKFNCPHCNQSLEAPEDMLGEAIECPACNGSIQIPARQPAPPPPPRTTPPEAPDIDFDSDAATDKQIAYIRALGGTPQAGLTKEAASELIDGLRNSAPPTTKQLDLLKKLGGTVTPGMTSAQVSDLISQLNDNQPPTKQQIKFIKMLGGEIPATKREASELCQSLPATAPATTQQQKQAEELGLTLPENATFAQANELLSDAEMDADPDEGKPPTKVQLNKIAKLGGDQQKATNRWRAEEYIEELEDKDEQFKDRIDEALDWIFGDPDSRSMVPVKKPNKAVMAKALQYGDAQGWGEGWESKDGCTEYDLMPVAVYAVAPELLKKNEDPPRLPGQSKGKGCLLPLILMAGAVGTGTLLLAVLVCFSQYCKQQTEEGRANKRVESYNMGRVDASHVEPHA